LTGITYAQFQSGTTSAAFVAAVVASLGSGYSVVITNVAAGSRRSLLSRFLPTSSIVVTYSVTFGYTGPAGGIDQAVNNAVSNINTNLPSKLAISGNAALVGATAQPAVSTGFVSSSSSAPTSKPTVVPTLATVSASATLQWSSIAASSSGANLYATVLGGGIYKSTTGASWTLTTAPTAFQWYGIDTDLTGQFVAAVGYSATVNPSYIWVYYSTNYGATFTAASVTILATGYTTPTKLGITVTTGANFAVTVGQNSWYVLLWAGGNHFVNKGSLGYYNAISSDKATSTIYTAVTSTGNVAVSLDAGRTFATTKSAAGNLVAVALSSTGKYQIVAANPGTLLVSSKSGQTWTPAGTTNAWVAVASDASGAKLVAAVANGGVYYSSNYGATFVVSTSFGSSVNWTSLKINSASVYATAAGTGIFIAAP